MEDELLIYFNELRRLAEAKCASRQDAEDLLNETYLAAYAYLRRGGQIAHPKTWLVNTLMHKRNSALRRQYRQPLVSLTDSLPLPEPDDGLSAFLASEEAAALRRALLYQAHTTREALIRHYYRGYGVADIARQLGIPEGTVKSRLSAGRAHIRKGWNDMINTDS